MGFSTYRGLIVIVVFIFMGVTFISLAISQSPEMFTSGGTNGQNPGVPGAQNPLNLMAWNVTNAIQLNLTNNDQDYDINGFRDVTFHYSLGGVGYHYLWVEKYDQVVFLGVPLWRYAWEDFTWYNYSSGSQISSRVTIETYFGGRPAPSDHEAYSENDLDTAYQRSNSTSDLKFRLSNSVGSFYVSFWFNTTAYSKPSIALQHEGIYISVWQDWSDRKTSINILSVLSGLFLGNLFGSNTLGLDPTFSSILTMILDVGVAIITFFVIRSLIPFLSSGND